MFSDFFGDFLQGTRLFSQSMMKPFFRDHQTIDSGPRVASGKVAENIMVCRLSLPWAIGANSQA